MDLGAVQQEVTLWSSKEQDELAAYLATLRLQRTSAYAEELSRRADDRTPEHWLTLDELKKKLQEG